MGWEVLLPLIAQYGIPLVESLWTKWASGSPPTAADFVELRALASQTALDRAKVALAAQGIDSSDPRYAQLLTLVS